MRGEAGTARRLAPRLRQVWRWFGDLNEARAHQRTVEPETGPLGRGVVWRVQSRPHRLSFADIAAWSHLVAPHVEPWQVAAIELLDKLMVDLIDAFAKGDPVATGKQATSANVKAFFDAFRAFAKKKGAAK